MFSFYSSLNLIFNQASINWRNRSDREHTKFLDALASIDLMLLSPKNPKCRPFLSPIDLFHLFSPPYVKNLKILFNQALRQRFLYNFNFFFNFSSSFCLTFLIFYPSERS